MPQERGGGSSSKRGSNRPVVDKSAAETAEAIRAEYSAICNYWKASPFQRENRVEILVGAGIRVMDGVKFKVDHRVGCANVQAAIKSHSEKYNGTGDERHQMPLIGELRQTYPPLIDADPPQIAASMPDFLIYLQRIVTDLKKIETHLTQLNNYMRANWAED